MVKSIFCAAIAGLIAVSSANAAVVTIDDFDTTNFQVVGAPSFGNSPMNPVTASGLTVDAIGLARTITNTRTNPTGVANAFGRQVQTVVTGGQASVSLGADTQGVSEFFWNAAGADLVDGTNDRVLIDVIDTDQTGISFSLAFNGVSITRFANGPSELNFNFSDFVGVDFTSVGAISLAVSGPTAFDTSFDNVRAAGNLTTTPMAPVPVPASLPLMVVGLAGLLAMRKTRSQS